MTTPNLLRPDEVDRLLRLPAGQARRMARRGELPHLRLPDGSIRFDQSKIERVIADAAQAAGQEAAR